MEIERLLPNPGATTIADQLAGFDPRSAAPPSRPYVYTNFVASVDGRATLGGGARKLGSPADTRMLMELRASADAVLVGAGTIREERYGRLLPDAELRERRERAGRAADPLAVIVTSRFELPWKAGLFSSGTGEVVIFTDSTDEPPETATPVRVERVRSRPDLAEVLSRLQANRGVEALLCEGGPVLHANLLGAGLIDELWVTTAATVVGGAGPTILEGLGEADRTTELRWLLRAGSELFARYALGAAD